MAGRVPGAASYEDDVIDGGFVHLGIAHCLLNRLQSALHRNMNISGVYILETPPPGGGGGGGE